VVVAQLTAGWRNWVDDAISAYVIPSSIRVDRWTVDFGDGTGRTVPGDGTDRLSTTHAYDAGTFDVVVTAHVSGQAYGAFFTPAGDPYEQVVPFALDITNSATGVSALPIEYVPPVVTVGASPSGTLPDGTLVAPDAAGHAALWWPRGLHCQLYVRPIIVTEGFMRSGGIVIGGATTRLLGYRYEPGVNDAADATAAGSFAPTDPIAIQWNTPLSGQRAYPENGESVGRSFQGEVELQLGTKGRGVGIIDDVEIGDDAEDALRLLDLDLFDGDFLRRINHSYRGRHLRDPELGAGEDQVLARIEDKVGRGPVGKVLGGDGDAISSRIELLELKESVVVGQELAGILEARAL